MISKRCTWSYLSAPLCSSNTFGKKRRRNKTFGALVVCFLAASRAHNASEELWEAHCSEIWEIAEGRARSCLKRKYKSLELFWKWRKETQLETANETCKASVQDNIEAHFLFRYGQWLLRTEHFLQCIWAYLLRMF